LLILWARSSWIAESIGWGSARHFYFLDSNSGRILFRTFWNLPESQRRFYLIRPPAQPHAGIFAGPICDYGPSYGCFGAPDWFILIFLLVMGLFSFLHARRLLRAGESGFSPASASETPIIPHRQQGV
jgi:hypothetical protein